jgi:hypothetical protein
MAFSSIFWNGLNVANMYAEVTSKVVSLNGNKTPRQHQLSVYVVPRNSWMSNIIYNCICVLKYKKLFWDPAWIR